jgi:sporulation protein YlmC with PRC-barrel domain
LCDSDSFFENGIESERDRKRKSPLTLNRSDFKSQNQGPWNIWFAGPLTGTQSIRRRNVKTIPAVLLACTLASPMAMAQNAATTAPSKNNASTAAAAGQWRASKLIGVNIYNEQNDKIGEVNEIILDSAGKVDGVVVSVGGFLGMGEHNVMMTMDKIRFSDEANKTRTGSTSSGSKQWYPDKGTVNATKDQLKAMQVVLRLGRHLQAFRLHPVFPCGEVAFLALRSLSILAGSTLPQTRLPPPETFDRFRGSVARDRSPDRNRRSNPTGVHRTEGRHAGRCGRRGRRQNRRTSSRCSDPFLTCG